jgi:hypothetical protein
MARYLPDWLRRDSAVPRMAASGSGVGAVAGALVVFYLAVCVVLGWWWNEEPNPFDPVASTRAYAERSGRYVTGYATTEAVIGITHTLLDKRGGYLSNDLMPPGVWMDNIPSWEYGVLTQLRDVARAYRIDFSRSRSQSREDPDLSVAEGHLFFDNASWAFPPSEREYRDGVSLFENYRARLTGERQPEARFYTRADNLEQWLQGVETRLGSLAQRLSASIGKRQIDPDIVADRRSDGSAPGSTDAAMPAAGVPAQETGVPYETEYKTPWLELDDVFYEARGHSWALLHLLRAMEHDFGDVLAKKNARVSFEQVIRELEPTQDTLWSPVILNGSGLGVLANHSLVMASHISRTSAAINDLRRLLTQG